MDAYVSFWLIGHFEQEQSYVVVQQVQQVQLQPRFSRRSEVKGEALLVHASVKKKVTSLIPA